MDLKPLLPIIEEIFKQELSENKYPFGWPSAKGMGNKVASGRLKNSIKAIQTDNNTIEILGPGGLPLNQTYGDWGGRGDVNLGRQKNQKGVPIDDLIQWIKIRNIAPKFSAEKQKLSFAIAINKKRVKENKKPVPVNILIKWMNSNSIVPNFDPYKSMAFAIQKNIKTFGIRRTNFIQNSLEVLEKNDKLIQKIEEITVEEIIDIIEGI